MLRALLRPVLHTTLFCSALALIPFPLLSQAAPGTAAAPSARILGTVTSMANGTVTVHLEGQSAGDVAVTLTPQSRLLRTSPGATSLKDAVPMEASDLAVGDRVLIRPTANSDSAHPTAGILVAMKQGDIAQAHQQEASDWQHRSLSGIVQVTDVSAGTVTLRPQAGAPPFVVHTTPATTVRHYAPDSTSFADAKKASFADIHPGDQLRARGEKDATGTQITAEEIVVGSFQNIAGTVLSTDPAGNTISVTDLATKRPVTLHLESSTQLRKLPPEMAARLARRQAAGAGGQGESAASTAAAANATGGPERPRGPADPAALLQRAPSITLADLNKGDAVMIVASGPGSPQHTAITLVAGVEPLLQASPEASAGLFSASWNLGGGGADSAGAENAPR